MRKDGPFIVEKVMDPYAKKYRRRLIINLVFIVSFTIVSALVIISYLGNLVGNYTLQIRRGERILSMADNVAFENATTRLRAEMVSGTYPITVDYLPDDDVLDGIDGSHNGTVDEVNNGQYLAYTFYLRNVGNEMARFAVDIVVEDMNLPIDANGFGMDEILRLRLYENEVVYLEDGSILTPTHNSTTFAKQTRHPVRHEGDVPDETRECVGMYGDEEYLTCAGKSPYRATPFYSSTQVHFDDNKVLTPGQTLRYTIVLWLEGWDPECFGDVPGSASITLGMTFGLLEASSSSTPESSLSDEL